MVDRGCRRPFGPYASPFLRPSMASDPGTHRAPPPLQIILPRLLLLELPRSSHSSGPRASPAPHTSPRGHSVPPRGLCARCRRARGCAHARTWTRWLWPAVVALCRRATQKIVDHFDRGQRLPASRLSPQPGPLACAPPATDLTLERELESRSGGSAAARQISSVCSGIRTSNEDREMGCTTVT